MQVSILGEDFVGPVGSVERVQDRGGRVGRRGDDPAHWPLRRQVLAGGDRVERRPRVGSLFRDVVEGLYRAAQLLAELLGSLNPAGGSAACGGFQPRVVTG